MPWIRVIDEGQATDELKHIYQQVAGQRGKVANIMKIHSLSPQTMKSHLDFYLSIQFAPGGITRQQREMLAVVVSAQNHCAYCLSHHAQALDHYWKDPKKLARFTQHFKLVPLSEADQAMLAYSDKLTRNPADVTAADVESLRQAGFSDEQTLSINLIVSYFNFVNRLALGLGVEFSPEEVQGYRY